MAPSWISRTTLAQYVAKVRAAPREVIWNKHLMTTAVLFGMCAIPMTWDQGMGASVPSLPGFKDHFQSKTGAKAKAIKDFVSLPYLGYIIGSTLSFFINDRIGRKWFLRLSVVIHAVGQLMAILAPDTDVLYASRIVTGIGIGGFTVIGPMTLSEIAPAETRGLITSFYMVFMGMALFMAQFVVLGINRHMPPSRLQYQIVFIIPVALMAVLVACSFFTCDSPIWLAIVGRQGEALENLAKLRGLPTDHTRVQKDMNEIRTSVAMERPKLIYVVKETLTKKSNLRRLQQTLITYALAQLSGANSLTSYFIPVVTLISPGLSTDRKMLLSGLYATFKFFSKLVAAFIFVDALGRRMSLFIGCSVQMVTHFYSAIYLNISQRQSVPNSYSQSELAGLFLHAFGYAVGLLILPYVFGSELWPNHIRAFGAAFSGAFHWAFIYSVKYAVPDLLDATDNWGAFIFFGGWCLIAIVYVYFVVPEVAGLTSLEIEEIFQGPWFKAYKVTKTMRYTVDEEDIKEDIKEGKGVEIETLEMSSQKIRG